MREKEGQKTGVLGKSGAVLEVGFKAKPAFFHEQKHEFAQTGKPVND